MNFLRRLARHSRLTDRALRHRRRATPPFLILFLNSRCNLTCEHCFYWRNLNRDDDLTLEEFRSLSQELGAFENLNLSGGEPFLRPEFAEIVRMFVDNNRARQVYVPTNGYYTSKTEQQVRATLQSETLSLLACEISLDGMPAYHNRFRGNPKSFERAMETCDMLADLQRSDPRVRLHAVSTATGENLQELRELTEFLRERCPAMDHHNLAIIRGDRKNPSLAGPQLSEYARLARHVAAVWRDREIGRAGSCVEPMLQWAKRRTIEEQRQFIPCTAGRLTGVVYANGDVSLCETHPPLGNLREKSFFEIWDSAEAAALRRRIGCGECFCTNEVFLWPSIVYQPAPLFRSWRGARAEREETSLKQRSGAPAS